MLLSGPGAAFSAAIVASLRLRRLQVATSVAVIDRLFLKMQAELPAFSAAPQERWRNIEAYVYCLRQSGTKDPTFFNAPRVGELLQLLPALPAVGELTTTAIRTVRARRRAAAVAALLAALSHAWLRSSRGRSSRCAPPARPQVGTHSDWLSHNPALLPPLLTFVAEGLTQDKTAAAASQAMKHLCEKCAEHLAEEATMAQLLQMYLGTLQLKLQTADRVDLIAALAFVVSQMPLHQVLPAMQAIAHPLLTRLREILQSGNSVVSEVAQLLDQICSLLREVSPTETASADTPALQDALHPSVQMLQSIWDVLDAVFVRHGSSSQCMEKLTRCYKHTAKNCRDSFGAVVPKLLEQVTAWYEQQPHSCFVYVVNWVLTSFSRQNEFHPLFAQTFQRVSQATFQLLSVRSTITDNPDVVDDYFELCAKVLRFMPPLLLESDLLQTVFQCGCAGLHILHREAGRSVTAFFEVLISLEVLACGRRSGRAEQVMQMYAVSRPSAVRPPEPATARPTARLCSRLLTILHSHALQPINLPEPGRSRLHGVVVSNGPTLANAVVTAIAGVLPPARVRFVAPLLKLLAEVDPQACAQWMDAAIKALPSGARPTRPCGSVPTSMHRPHPTPAPHSPRMAQLARAGYRCARRREHVDHDHV